MSSEVSPFAVGPIRRGLHLAIMTESNTTWDYKMSYQHPLRTTNIHLASGQTVMTDAPQDNHGLGQMFSPTDLLSTSLAACVATIIGIHVNSKDYELISIDANIQKKMASHPAGWLPLKSISSLRFRPWRVTKIWFYSSAQGALVQSPKASIQTSFKICRSRSNALSAFPP